MKNKITVFIIFCILIVTGIMFWYEFKSVSKIEYPIEISPENRTMDRQLDDNNDYVKEQRNSVIEINSGVSFDFDDSVFKPIVHGEEFLQRVEFSIMPIFESMKNEDLSELSDAVDALNMDVYDCLVYPMIVHTVEYNKDIDNFHKQILEFMEEDIFTVCEYDVSEISREWITEEVNGEKWLVLNRSLKARDVEFPLYINEKSAFIQKNDHVYQISNITLDKNAEVVNIDKNVMKFLNKLEQNSISTRDTMVFEDFERTTVFKKEDKKRKQDVLNNIQLNIELKKLLQSLQKGPYWDTTKNIDFIRESFTKCNYATSSSNIGDMQIQGDQRLYFQIEDAGHMEYEDENKKLAFLHAYDTNGNHTGPVDENLEQMEENAHNIGIIHRWPSTDSYTITFRNDINGRLDVIGNGDGFIILSVEGDGGECLIIDLVIPVIAGTIIKIPIHDNGSIGPMSYDVDGDGVEDMQISLKYPIIQEKEKELGQVFMKIKELKAL